MFVNPASASTLTTATQVSAGGRTTCAVMTGGNAYCWGDNTYGQLGNGTTANSATPVLVSGGYTWASISTEYDTYAGDNVATTCGVTTSGVGYCWGANTYGDVGDGTTTQRTTPTAISGGYSWLSISVGWRDTCGVTTTAVGYCWGSNWAGEGGNGSTSQKTSPTVVSGNYTWASISAGWSNTCGVTVAGAGYCWGRNNAGQVGDGTTTQRTSPTFVSGYTWSTITVGGTDSCGITSSGAAYCWGNNWSGEVGDGTTTERDSPTAVLGAKVWLQISEGWGTTCALATSGTAYCWGYNNAGEVGDGTTANRSAPTVVSGGLTFSGISAGNDHTNGTDCGLAQDGIVYCWGYNNMSQIGDGTTTNRSVATESSLLYASISNTATSVTIDPTFTFTVGNQSSACNGESSFVTSAGSASAVALGHLSAGSNVSGGQALTVADNAGNGFAVYLSGNQASQNLRSSTHSWTDVAGSYASPAALGSGEGFGYTYHDSTTSSSVINPSSTNFIALTNATTNAVMGSSSSMTGSGCVSYDAQTSASTPAGTYAATVIYTAIPTF